MDWLDLLAVQGTLKSLLQHHSSKESILPTNSTSGVWGIHIHFIPPTNSGRSLDPASPPPFLLSATLLVPESLGQLEQKPSSKQGPRSLGTTTSSLCTSVVKENETHRHIFQSTTPSLTRKWQTQWGPNPSTDPACYPPLGDQWRAIWPSLLPSAGNREGRLSIRTLSLLVSTSFFPLTTSGEARRWGG